jgi:hypothetical protein
MAGCEYLGNRPFRSMAINEKKRLLRPRLFASSLIFFLLFYFNSKKSIPWVQTTFKTMVSSSSKSSGKRDSKSVASSASKNSKPSTQVQVVTCPAAFPISTKTAAERKRPRDDSQKGFGSNRSTGRFSKKKQNKGLLDWHDTVKEIRAYGAGAFEGKQKRDYQDEQYFNLTGRHKKKPQTPLPIVRGIKKAAAKRDAKAREEARQAGVVLPKAKRETKKADPKFLTYGPAPSIGFVKQGVFRVQKKNRK